MMRQLQASGKSLRAIAEALNADGHITRRGAEWNQVQIKRVLDRMETSLDETERINSIQVLFLS
jgi:hypothetical protein